MKKLLIFVFFTGICLSLMAQNPIAVPKVDERTELLSIVFRLAGAREYKSDLIPPAYASAIETWFAPYRNHEAIVFAANKLYGKYSIGYDAVMSYAVHIGIDGGRIGFIEGLDDGGLYDRWKKKPAKKFLKLLNKFYKDSRFNDFFVSQQPLYAEAEARFDSTFKTVHTQWYGEFYGTAAMKNVGELSCILSIANGPNNYGVSVVHKEGTKYPCPVISTWVMDSVGMPVYQPQTIEGLVIHEFSHPFCNPLVDKYYDRMETGATAIFGPVSERMKRNAYPTPRIMMYEMMVRACVLQYCRQYQPALVNTTIRSDQQKGFLWVAGLSTVLAEYQKNREEYPSMEDFMPRIVEYINSLSPADIPSIVSTNIAPGSTDVDPGLKEIVVQFDRPMLRMSNLDFGKKGKEYLPALTATEWRAADQWVVHVNLKADTEYSIAFPGHCFLSDKYVGGNETFYLDFRTAGME